MSSIEALKNNAGAMRSVVRVGYTLLGDTRTTDPELRRLYREHTTRERQNPQNNIDSIPAMLEVVREFSPHSPLTSFTFQELLEIWKMAVQFTDDHNELISDKVLPSEADVRTYIDSVMASPSPLTIDKQFEMLLTISEGDIVRAGITGMMASRLMARAGDTGLYPNIHIDPKDMSEWAQKMTQFESNHPNVIYDLPGDTYYFWTHFVGSVAFGCSNQSHLSLLDKSFQYGTSIMSVARGFAGSPTITSHREASELGRQAGAAIVAFSQELENI
ncbi:hypothetical protein A3H80_00600 [Candidatus Roizmanbacteria bacterium RIFCSPLOWO2_02_FULL_37_19]|uniref:Uncharacterized protein n=1 Tax=Candidatus Roizmanbacteria bacterium RIFCSPHIGHO2_02_FULL_37_24 TaxID=1802037 RepID=A0A1F7GVM7_9BACT|nr:MAG: hypothetical protein A2862_00290 [Candidatus Roizmanbacteria bacterium RIFCSPHIGHO2_01_FULL_38_41]OGK22636.1 MAG: hypothetical protein A3C24_00405 [Candidatus Roizmanbacteria bacterium RIFCSPHIGHO2_02_FULL_37_24]OGK32487.1 MAG: hypothetical protein A3E10_00470 [Candidatus Roizmanbacteria bacterium RIFCSPHIGHO2_12_FULL_37_23]OGK54466.1 MAG: hypothetical protein A3H80_00600 [Candidatus Roizmanbacteria bacterium RIFCSPLOWO2_02_FULL_37_19]OGK59316.1 MAG: hypothetical protein A3G65_00115 [Ca